MNKFEIVSHSLKISYNGVVTLLIAKKDISIVSNELYKTVPRVVLYNLNGGYNETVFSMPLSICSQEGTTPFSVNSVLLFSENNLGF